DGAHPGPEDLAFEPDRQAPHFAGKWGGLEHACRLLKSVARGKANGVPVGRGGLAFVRRLWRVRSCNGRWLCRREIERDSGKNRHSRSRRKSGRASEGHA